jgi:hypothetical protein
MSRQPGFAFTLQDASTTLLGMTKRFQVLMDDDQFRTIQRLAKKEGLTTAEWVRRRLREGSASTPDTAAKLAAIDAAFRHSAPAPDIDQMVDEIEDGYHAPPDAPDEIPGIRRRT